MLGFAGSSEHPHPCALVIASVSLHRLKVSKIALTQPIERVYIRIDTR